MWPELYHSASGTINCCERFINQNILLHFWKRNGRCEGGYHNFPQFLAVVLDFGNKMVPILLSAGILYMR